MTYCNSVTNNDFIYKADKFNSHTRVSLGAYQQKIDRKITDVQAQAFYTRIKSDNNYKIYDKNNLKIEAISSVDIQAIAGTGTVTAFTGKQLSDNDFLYDGVAKIHLGGKATYSNENAETSLTLFQHAHISATDIRTYTDLTPVFDYQQINLNSKYSMDDKDLTLFSDTIMILDREFWPRGESTAGIKYKNTKLSTGIQGATDSDAPLWVPGSEQKAFVGAQHQDQIKGHDIDLFINFSKSEIQDNISAGFEFKF